MGVMSTKNNKNLFTWADYLFINKQLENLRSLEREMNDVSNWETIFYKNIVFQ